VRYGQWRRHFVAPLAPSSLRSAEFIELGLQVDDLLLQLFVLGPKRIGNPQVVAAATAN
jgi:hypothetical protein